MCLIACMRGCQVILSEALGEGGRGMRFVVLANIEVASKKSRGRGRTDVPDKKVGDRGVAS